MTNGTNWLGVLANKNRRAVGEDRGRDSASYPIRALWVSNCRTAAVIKDRARLPSLLCSAWRAGFTRNLEVCDVLVYSL